MKKRQLSTGELLDELEIELKKQEIREKCASDPSKLAKLRNKTARLKDKLKFFRSWFGGGVETAALDYDRGRKKNFEEIE